MVLKMLFHRNYNLPGPIDIVGRPSFEMGRVPWLISALRPCPTIQGRRAG